MINNLILKKFNYSISIDNKFIITDPIEGYISIELPICWSEHSKKCNDCKELFDDIFNKKNSIKDRLIENWIAYYSNKTYYLESNNFSNVPEHDDNFYCEYNFIKTKIKFTLKEFDISNEELIKYEKLEKFEICDFIKNYIDKN